VEGADEAADFTLVRGGGEGEGDGGDELATDGGDDGELEGVGSGLLGESS
jgi:hypothetical protein